jgi:hypothetical protein
VLKQSPFSLRRYHSITFSNPFQANIDAPTMSRPDEHTGGAGAGTAFLSTKDGNKFKGGDEHPSPCPRPSSPIDILLCEDDPVCKRNLRKHWATENQLLDIHRFDKDECTPDTHPAKPPKDLEAPGPLHGTG